MFFRRPQNWLNRSALAFVAVVGLLVTAGKAFIVDGTPILKGDTPQVFAILRHDEGVTRICTATLIHPRLLLTAAHCLPESGDPSGISVTDSSNVKRPEWESMSFRPVAIGRHPVYGDASLDDLSRTGYDLGFIVLDREATAEPHLLFAANSKWDRQFLASKTLTLYGYGESTRDPSLWGKTSGVKRFGLVRPKTFTSTLFSIETGSQNIAPGDSGGPAVLHLNGRPHVVGIASGSPALADEERHTPLSVFSLLRRETVCWVQNQSRIDLGFFCPSSPNSPNN